MIISLSKANLNSLLERLSCCPGVSSKSSTGPWIQHSKNLYLSTQMIEQTELVVTEWYYHPPINSIGAGEKLFSSIGLDVMKKRAPTKKGIACRFSCHFTLENENILKYVAEDSYVIDLEHVIDRQELLRMIRNSYSKFKERFDLRKPGTVIQDKTLRPLDETQINFDAILPLLL